MQWSYVPLICINLSVLQSLNHWECNFNEIVSNSGFWLWSLHIYMKGPKPKWGISHDFVKLAFSVTEALKNTQIDTLIKYITLLQYNFYSAFGSQITIDLKIVRNSSFWLWTLHIYIYIIIIISLKIRSSILIYYININI